LPIDISPPKPWRSITAAEKHPDQIEHQRRHDPGQQRLDQPSRGHAGDRDALCRELLGERRINPRGDESRLAVRLLVLELALDRILADRDLGDLALLHQLLELSIGNRLDGVVGRQQPLQQQHADAGQEHVTDGNGLLAGVRVGFHVGAFGRGRWLAAIELVENADNRPGLSRLVMDQGDGRRRAPSAGTEASGDPSRGH